MEGCPQLLDLIPRDGDWRLANKGDQATSEEEKLELSLGPPGGPCVQTTKLKPPRKPQRQHKASSSLFQLQTAGSDTGGNGAAVEPEKRAFSVAYADPALHSCGIPNKRNAAGPVVGWPPIRSFRKNISNGSCSKLAPDSSPPPAKASPAEGSRKTLFVKINMEGIPIGRKVDLKAYDSYEKLSCAVDSLFRGLVAAQTESRPEREDYTLVYEDNEGDKMLVGDVPWEMFIATVKRLRVQKRSELHLLSRPGLSKLCK